MEFASLTFSTRYHKQLQNRESWYATINEASHEFDRNETIGKMQYLVPLNAFFFQNRRWISDTKRNSKELKRKIAAETRFTEDDLARSLNMIKERTIRQSTTHLCFAFVISLSAIVPSPSNVHHYHAIGLQLSGDDVTWKFKHVFLDNLKKTLNRDNGVCL